MPDMTLQEALQTPEVKGYLGQLLRETAEELFPDLLKDLVTGDASLIESAVKSGIEAATPALRESLREEIAKDGELDTLHTEAISLIEAAPLPDYAKDRVKKDYELDEVDGKPKPARGLAIIEATYDKDGNVTKSAKQVLREAIEQDVKDERDVLREAAPTLPFAAGGGAPPAAPAKPLGENSAFAKHARLRGLDPAKHGPTKIPDPAPAA